MKFIGRTGGIIAIILILFLSGILFLGCQPTEQPLLNIPVADDPTCEDPGIVEEKIIADSSRGYDYNYWIYLPPCYEQETDRTYPVLYLMPGRGGHPSDWFNASVNDIADEMILSGEMPSFIIVATEDISTDPLVEMIYNEVVPIVETNYRVNPNRHYHSVADGSLGSVGAYRMALQHPDDFASVGMFGGGLIHGEEERVQGWLDAITTENRPRFFLNSGEQDPFMIERAEVMIDVLDEAQFDHTEIFSPGGHNYGYWALNFPAYFEWLAADWEVEAE